MLPKHQVLRAAPRFAAQIRAPVQRRFMSSPTSGPSTESAFARERRAVKEHAHASTALWRKISLYVVPVALAASAANAYYLWNEHWEHWSHMPPLEERIEYPYQNIRTKNYQWGDGDKTIFWNDNVNYHNKDKTT
ncbi:hypothetical protein RB597_005656 [Gaeumannomyces tritici]